LIFADTSFLVSLYLPNDRFTPLARTVAAGFRSAVAYPLLTEVELTNTVWRAVGQKHISKELASDLLRDVNVGGRIKTSQWGSNQNQPLFSFKPVGDVLARG
jgi:predicted nucleic acid-binding protein